MKKKNERQGNPSPPSTDQGNPPPIGGPIIIRQIRSPIGRPQDQREALKGLGLRRIGHEVVRQDTPAVRGQIRKIPHLVEVVEPYCEISPKQVPAEEEA